MQTPEFDSYDVVIVGGAIYGSSVAWWLTQMEDFDGRVLVIERDPTYEFAATSHTNSCIRQQFSSALNIQISQFGAEFINNFQSFMGDDPRVPPLILQNFGYLYLADTPEFAASLAEAQSVQAELGAATRHMSAKDIAEAYPFYMLDDIVAGNHNTVNEGYFDGNTMFDWWKRRAREGGVEYLHNEVTGLDISDGRITAVRLASGDRVSCGQMVNCAGTRSPLVAKMAGIDLPIEPRKRYTFIFKAEDALPCDLPLTIDPSGVHMRTDGEYYMAGCPPDDDRAVALDDFEMDHGLWEAKVWPAIATRVPAFERVKLINTWVGHYDFNTFDQNALLGPHWEIANYVNCNGFSGHGLQQSAAVGRGIAEWLAFGEYRSLDLVPLGLTRLRDQNAYVEKAVI